MTSPISPDVPQPISPLDTVQWRAAVSDMGHRLVVGGPGTGKTRTVHARVIALVAAGEAASSIAVLTFSARAADEMKREIETSIDAKRLDANPDDVFVGTPGALCLEILRQFGCPDRDLPTHFSLWDQPQCAGVIERLSNDPELRDHKIQPGEIRRLIEWHSLNQHRDDLAEIRAPDGSWHRLVSAFREEKRQQIALDFDDLLRFTIRALEQDADLCEQLSARRIRHLIVDDFQEFTPLQYRVLRLLTQHSSTVTVAADSNQSIHAARGADLWLLQNWRADYKVRALCHLTLNHRAKGALVNVAKTLQESTDLAGLQLDHQESVRPPGAHPQLLVHDGPIEGLDRQAVDIIQSLHDHDGYAFEDIAVLYPNSSAGPRIATRMGAQRIPYQVLDRRLVPDAPDYELVRSLLGVAVHPRDQAAFHTAATAGLHQSQVTRFDALMPKLVHIARQLNGDLVHAADLYLQEVPRDSVMVRRARHVVDAVTMLRREWTQPGTSVSSIVSTACNQVALTTRLGTLPILSPTLRRLVDAAENFPVAGRSTAHLGLIAFLDHLAASSDPVQRTPVSDPLFYPPDGVVLGTIRSAQGRQWRAVLLVDCTDEAIPGDLDNVVDVHEPQRLFYVAVTRAADRLYLLVPLVGEAHQRQNPSRFIAPLRGILERRQV